MLSQALSMIISDTLVWQAHCLCLQWLTGNMQACQHRLRLIALAWLCLCLMYLLVLYIAVAAFRQASFRVAVASEQPWSSMYLVNGMGQAVTCL